MKLAALSERMMAMCDETWDRHANPWSAWSRLTMLPLFAVCAFSRIWLGWWALAPAAVTLLWLWGNPRVFPPPRDHRSWMTRGVLGERLWLNRSAVTIPREIVYRGQLYTAISAIGFAAYAVGLVRLDPIWTIAGMVVAMAAKLAFVRLMAHLHDRSARDEARPG